MGKGEDGQRQDASDHALQRVGVGVSSQTVRRQVYIYLFLIGVGVYFVAGSGLEKMYLINLGAAFIIVGAVGLVTSMTATDIRTSCAPSAKRETRRAP